MNLSVDPQPPRGGRYRTASEIGTYLYCKRAWWFERQRAPSLREPERVRGTAFHEQHGARVATAQRVGGIARAVLLMAVLLFLVGAWMAVSVVAAARHK